jgi:hypothetical protein
MNPVSPQMEEVALQPGSSRVLQSPAAATLWMTMTLEELVTELVAIGGTNSAGLGTQSLL